MSVPADDFTDLGCGQCGGGVDADYRCVDCGYSPLDDDDDDYWLLLAGEFTGSWPPMVELGPIGKEALG